ncbi:MAG TPA: sulfide-dependent adenosine diphosphate thiazole synthase [Armatimonadota bacterium]|nr:sulfide-dependent adenosine diphosphate thiazole synthase [Armatimonadota bacterium]
MALFAPVQESDITRAIIERSMKDLLAMTPTDVVIVGGGPSGLVAARDLASQGVRTVIFEANNYLGGGFWLGGYLFSHLTVRAPAHEMLAEVGVPYEEYAPGLYTALAPHCVAKFIGAACDAGAIVIGMTMVDDVCVRQDNRVAGVVINWNPVRYLPKAIAAIDPVSVECRLVIDCTGHDARVCQCLAHRGLLELKGMGGMWVNESEDAIVEQTGEVHPGLIAAGMAVSTVYGVPRMGPTFGGMLLSGRRAAQLAMGILERDA